MSHESFQDSLFEDPLGLKLKHAREKAGMSKEIAAQQLKFPLAVVEAIEKPDAAFCLGVQWHPENFWRTGEFDGLFSAFVAAAAERHPRD